MNKTIKSCNLTTTEGNKTCVVRNGLLCIHFSARKQLYACMRLVMQNCPDAEEHLLVSGHDQGAIEKSIDVLCDNKRGNYSTV